MTDLAIRVENLSKQCRIDEREPYKTLRDTITDALYLPFRRLRSALQTPTALPSSQHFSANSTIWALKEVSLDISRGEIVGVIGRNGAGKTTLLKILSRITEPTRGFAEIRGRVGSLLEVGIGFHAELTGRENIYLNGAILGMKKREIDRSFDEIVSFAEVEKFIDTPVKHYSSGMHVRLAFAVTAHLQPEILLVDEVLAVGDNAFQKKCLEKMGEVAGEGKTVLLVSHSIPSILQLCKRTILLEQGRVRADGPTKQVVEDYLSTGIMRGPEVVWDPDSAPGGADVKLRAVRIRNHEGQLAATHQISDPITLETDFWCLKADLKLNVSFHVYSALGICVFATSNYHDHNWAGRSERAGLYRASCQIPGYFLNEGPYKISCFVVGKDGSTPVAHEDDVLSFQVYDNGETRGDYRGAWIGVVRPLLPWKIEPLA